MKFLVVFLCAAVFAACGGRQEEAPKETPSQGSLTIYCDEQVMPLMRAEVAAYDSIYPQVHLSLVPVSAREAVVKLLSGESKLIVLGRRFVDAERALTTKYNLTYGEYEIAKDALAVVVNTRNSVDTMSVEQLKEIMLGTTRNWSSVRTGMNVPLKVVVPKPDASSYVHLVDGVTRVDLKTADVVCDSAGQLLAAVRANAGAIGVVDWNCVWNDSSVRVLRLAGTDSTGAAMPAAMLHPAYIHLKKYPLLHSVYGYTTEGHPALAKGFMAFVCNAEGQKIALAQALVPSTQIIRLREPD